MLVGMGPVERAEQVGGTWKGGQGSPCGCSFLCAVRGVVSAKRVGVKRNLPGSDQGLSRG